MLRQFDNLGSLWEGETLYRHPPPSSALLLLLLLLRLLLPLPLRCQYPTPPKTIPSPAPTTKGSERTRYKRRPKLKDHAAGRRPRTYPPTSTSRAYTRSPGSASPFAADGPPSPGASLTVRLLRASTPRSRAFSLPS